MSVFLNTQKLRHWIKELIDSSNEELIFVVPYIHTSEIIYEALKKADEREVGITLVYRENKLTKEEKSKLLGLKNLNLLHHPNIHCKCYFNGELLIICSMNLYEYSEKNNREMGVLFHRDEIEDEDGFSTFGDSNHIFYNAIDEIREIINGSMVEKINTVKHKESFDIELIKTNEELEQERCTRLNKYFLNKKFKPCFYGNHVWHSKCENYFDKVDVIFEENRVALKFNLSENDLEVLYNKWMRGYGEYEYRWFKYYWNYQKSFLYLYRDSRFDWDGLKDAKLYHSKLQEGISYIIGRYRDLTGK